jgi:4-aminobutyrate aminotransferase
VEDVDGNIYIDLTAAFAVANAGHCHPKVVDAVRAQAQVLTHTPGYMSTNLPRAELAKLISEIVPKPLSKTHFMSGGGEAIETAYKLARHSTGAHDFIAFEGAFHGRGHAALSLTSRRAYRKHFLPVLPGVHHLPFPYAYRWTLGDPEKCLDLCLNYVDHVISDPASGATDVAAVITETVQAHEGWIVPPKGFLKGLRKICDEHNVLLILDEIVTGFGRTGKMFYFEHEGIIPDIVALGKGMASGFPISAAVATDKIMDIVGWGDGAYSTTFSGNPLCCAAAIANIHVIQDDKLVEHAARLGNYFIKSLKDLTKEQKIVGDIRGIGMLVGIEFVKNQRTKEPALDQTKKVINRSMKNGLMLQPPGGKFRNVIKMSPPLVITKEQIDKSLDILTESIRQVDAEYRS